MLFKWDNITDDIIKYELYNTKYIINADIYYVFFVSTYNSYNKYFCLLLIFITLPLHYADCMSTKAFIKYVEFCFFFLFIQFYSHHIIQWNRTFLFDCVSQILFWLPFITVSSKKSNKHVLIKFYSKTKKNATLTENSYLLQEIIHQQ